MSDFYGRYQHVSHAELYQQLMAGQPGQVDGLAAEWQTMEQTLNSLAGDLESDLEKLRTSWQSASGEEFQRRVRAIVQYARDLADSFHNVREGLTMMSGPLREAQAKAEHPDETDDYDKTIKGALYGSVAGVPGMLIGGIYGHQKDEEEREKAHQRMVRLVANLAADYNVTKETRWRGSVAAPAALPDSAQGGGLSTSAAGASTRAAAAPAAGSGGSLGSKDIATPATVQPGPAGGSGAAAVPPGGVVPDVEEYGTTLSGAGGAPGTTLVGAGGAGGLTGAVGSTGASSPATGSWGQPGGTTANLLSGGPAAGRTVAPLRGGMDAGRVTIVPGRGGVLTGSQGGGDLGVRSGGADQGRSGVASGRATTVVSQSGTASRATGAAARGAAPMGRMPRQDDQQDERLTWLTEDDLVWQSNDDVPPPVLGG